MSDPTTPASAGDWLAQWGPVVVALIGATALLIGYVYQKRAERRNHLFETKRKAYREYLNAWSMNAVGTAPDKAAKLVASQIDLFIVASDPVMKAVANLFNYTAENPPGSPGRDKATLKARLGELVLAMRRDCFEKSELELDEIVGLLPID